MLTLKEIRQLDVKGIRAEIQKVRQELHKYMIDVTMKKEKNTSRIPAQKKYVAKLQTVMNEKLFLHNLDTTEKHED